MKKVQTLPNKPNERQWKKERQQNYNNGSILRKKNSIFYNISTIGEYHTENIYESNINPNYQEPKHPRIKE